MSTMHDIYDPPPAPVPLAPPLPERVNYRPSDLVILGLLVIGVVGLAAWAYAFEPAIAYLTLVGGAIVIVESWSTALGFLHKRPWMGLNGRWKIFVAALIPWLLGLGLAAALMISLFLLSDWAG
jgi:hypothetical protein